MISLLKFCFVLLFFSLFNFVSMVVLYGLAKLFNVIRSKLKKESKENV